MIRSFEMVRRAVIAAGAALAIGSAAAPEAAAQYFGRNKVHYEQFDFKVLQTANWNIHYYPEAADAVEDIARMAERWYERFARQFQHEFDVPKPLVIYADHPDFQQTNTLSGMIGQGTGGVTESLKNRVIMPLTASYAETDRILGHELVHAFQYNIAQSATGGGIMSLARLPLWIVEGMAEYLSLGREHPHTAMWLRDHILRDDKPDLLEITRDPKYFAYRFGQGFISWLGGTYGDVAVQELFREGVSRRGMNQSGWRGALESVFGMSQDSLAMLWWEAVEEQYRPLMASRTDPYSTGDLLICEECGAGSSNVAPSLSPDGRYLVFQSERDLFSMDMFLAEVATGRILRPLQRNETPYIDGIRYIDSSGSWSPDGSKLVFVIFADGNNQLAILDIESGELEDRIEIEGLGAVQNPAWSPDGSRIAFSGLKGGITDLYVYDFEDGGVRQLTRDRHTELQPAWSPDGGTLAFTTDRGPGTDFSKLVYDNYILSLIDVESGEIEDLSVFAGAKHTNPVFDRSGEGIFFISDPDGFPDIYHIDLDDGTRRRMTRTATGISGITMLSPAFSYSAEADLLAFSVFHERGYIINTARPDEVSTVVNAVADSEAPHPGRILPPNVDARRSLVQMHLDDPVTGLAASGLYAANQSLSYDPDLQLDYIGTPSIGVGADTYGTYAGGATSAYFSDMLGNRRLGVALNVNGTFRDFGGQALFMNQKRRLNWGVSVQHTPLMRQFWGMGRNSFFIYRERMYVDAMDGILAYPLSSTRRIELAGGAQRLAWNVERDNYEIDAWGRVVGFDREASTPEGWDPLYLASASLAFVGDNSFTGFTSPVRGERFRFETRRFQGTVGFTQLSLDYRRYFNAGGPLTLALRGFHLGRYGDTENLESNRINPLFLGTEWYMRGYAYESYDRTEACQISYTGSTCGSLDRLFGQRLGVLGAELRFPFTGIERFGILNFPYLPVEFTAFTDVGMAWDDTRALDLSWSRDASNRVPLVSSGFSARANLLGFLILETYYAYPWQRPDKGWHWGFHIAPGW